MNIFGLGPLEILLIVVLALIVFGPAKLPEIMGQVGKAIADFRRATSDLSDEFNRTIQAELAEGRSLVEDTKSTVTGVHSSINAAIGGAAAPTLTAPAPAQTLAGAPSNGVNNNGAAAVATEDKPPLADTAQWSWETAAPAPAGPAVETVAADAVATSAPTTGVESLAADAVATSAPTTTSIAEGPAAESVRPVSAPTAEPARRRTGSRRDSRRDDLLPPY